MRCSFCGYEFDKTTTHGCEHCPLHTTCGKVKCPNCGFEMPKENLVARRFRRRRHRAGSEKRGRGYGAGGAGKEQQFERRITLSQLNNGDNAVISQIDTSDQRTLNKIMALGILPGMRVTVIQRYPTFVFQVGNTRVTADNNLVNRILIHR